MIASTSCPYCTKPHVVYQGKDEVLVRTEKLTAMNWLDDNRYFETRILRKVIFTNLKSHLNISNRSAVRA
jgi:hypothetical protein